MKKTNIKINFLNDINFLFLKGFSIRKKEIIDIKNKNIIT
jgi:hypothetical protein